jgi:preprotein translocase subunit YajC
MYSDKVTQSVAEAAKKVMEELKGQQHKIDANKNNKIDSHDFELLRKKKKVEEETELTESHFKVGDKVKCKTSGMTGEVVKLDKEDGAEDDKYYTVKREDGTMKKMAPEDMTKINEDVEQIDEYDSKQGVYKHKGTYGSAKGAEYGATDYKKENELAKAADKEKKKPARKAYGARQNFVRSYAKESFSGMMNVYKEGGLKSLHETLVKEEPTNAEFTAEVQNAKDKAELKKKQPDLAKPSVQAVKVEEDLQDMHVINADIANGVEMTDIEEDVETLDELSKSTLASYAKKSTKDARMTQSLGKEFEASANKSRKPGMKDAAQALADKYKSKSRSREAGVGKAIDRLAKEEVDNIQERSLTEPEMKKKEDIVKGMKKNLAGFKDRYGDRAKEVMYATATKQAMKESAESEHYKAGHDYASDHAQDSGFKVTARARKKEMLADNPHPKKTKEHDDWHRGANDGHQMALGNM